ncbi:MAG: hypothetical protein KAH15_02035 [Candidatus Marinimicrobia bacterium]|nr:hypothetical protein [Candidatus Neomarinimicrobiota bacterium]
MPSNLEKGKQQRLKVTQYYANTSQFIIRLLIGLAMYVVVRIVFMSVMMGEYKLPVFLGNAPAELVILILTAGILLLLPWMKGTRLHLIALSWMPAIACIAFVEWIKFFMVLMDSHAADKLYSLLPYVLPLTFFVLIWIFSPVSRIGRLITSIVLGLLCLFWIVDMPKTVKQARELHAVVIAYEQFYDTLQVKHEAPADITEQEEGSIYSIWSYKLVDVVDYRIDTSISEIQKLEYVQQIDIIIPDIFSRLRMSQQELYFDDLEDIDICYFYKYSTQRHLILENFAFSGDGFFRAEYSDGSKIFLDNVLVRKK